MELLKTKTSTEFNFIKESLINTKNYNINLTFKEHNQELTERIIQVLLVFSLLFCYCVLNVKTISQFLEASVSNIKFFQSSPEQYFFLSLQISFYTAFFLESPIIWIQIIFYFLPAFKIKERFPIFFLVFVSILLFFLVSLFSYYFLVPTALSFFLFYIVDVLEPLWSFKEYFDFVLVLYLSSIYIFQLPVIQLIFGILGFCSAKLYFRYLKYIILIATVVSAVFTPSTDPVTQIIFAGAILILYSLGAGLVFYFEKYKIIY